MYLTPTENHWACDIEADGLYDEVTQVWCSTLLNVVTKEELSFVTAAAFREWHQNHPEAIFVGHNFLAYDAPVMNRLWAMRVSALKIVDTFVLSQLYNPSMKAPKGCKKGPHSLEAWGIRLNYRKGEFAEFHQFSPEMLKYCHRDTRLTALLFIRLTERMRQTHFSEKGVELEHLAWNIIQNKQYRNGFPFDYRKALDLYVTLRAREEDLKSEIHKLWPPQLEVIKEYPQSFKKNGDDTANFTRHCGQYPKVERDFGGGYRVFDWVEFNLGSPSQRINKLLDMGWKPATFTKAGNPKVDEDGLLAFAELSGQAEVKALAKWIVINSRANMVNTWLEAYNTKTKAVHGKLFLASTLRYKHSAPNSSNIPSVRHKKLDDGSEVIMFGEEGMFTYECRDLWTSGSDEFTLVGIDGTGIQNRCLIHNLIKTVGEEAVRDFKTLALEGDVHKHNIKVLGLANKPAAKKFYYTLMMGGGGARLAADQVQFGTHMTAAEGDAKKQALVGSIPGFHDLIAKLKRELERTGRIILCDDSPILVPSPHMVIPYLLQGDESRLMKQALIYLDRNIRANGHSKDVFKVADIHDEWQFRVRTKVLDEFLSYALSVFPEAGETFSYNILIEGDAKTGRTWAETH